MRNFLIVLLLINATLFFSCEKKTYQKYLPDHENIRYSGRIDFSNDQEPLFVGSASSAEIGFTGDSCTIFLKKLNPQNESNYVAVELDGEYLGRYELEEDDFQRFSFPVIPSEKNHVIKIFKATEASNNQIAFGGIRCESLTTLPPASEKKIEFIGNSITCGMGNDLSDIPCDSGNWFDQHNAYWAYGPIVARKLGVQFMLSSVSGIGIYRNWNSMSPVMPDVYESLYLNSDDTEKYDFSSYSPDLVSICLGTNDMSLGDGTHERLPFDSTTYVKAYIEFIKTVYSKYPGTQICLLTSPMVKNEKGKLLKRCLEAVQLDVTAELPNKKKIRIFDFPEGIEPHGCSYHPDIENHKQMAEALLPFYKEVMSW